MISASVPFVLRPSKDSEGFFSTLLDIVIRTRGHPLRLVPTIFFLWASSSPGFALETINVSYPSPAPFYIPVAVALHQGFFREQSLDVKLIVTRAEVDRAALISGDIDFTRRIGSTILSAARGLPVRTVFLTTLKPFWMRNDPKRFAAEPSNVMMVTRDI